MSASVIGFGARAYGPVDFAHTPTSGLLAAPLPRQMADRSVGKLVGFLAAPHQAVTRTSSASHCTVQDVASQADRTSRTPAAGPGGPEGPTGPGGPGSPCGPCGACPHAPKVRAIAHGKATSRIFIMPPTQKCTAVDDSSCFPILITPGAAGFLILSQLLDRHER